MHKARRQWGLGCALYQPPEEVLYGEFGEMAQFLNFWRDSHRKWRDWYCVTAMGLGLLKYGELLSVQRIRLACKDLRISDYANGKHPPLSLQRSQEIEALCNRAFKEFLRKQK